MKKAMFFSLEELKDLVESKFDCGVKFNVIEKELDGETINVDIVEIFHSKDGISNLNIPYLERKEEHLSIIELNDFHFILRKLFKEDFNEMYEFVEYDMGNGREECIVFYLE